MKNLTTFILALFLFSSIHLLAQHDHSKCSHKQSFDRSLNSDTLDALSYEIHLNEVNTTAKTIDGTTKVVLSSKLDGINQVTLELLDLTVNEVKVDGNVVTDFEHNNPFLYVPLSSPINTGDEVEVEVSYSGEPFHEGWGGFHFSGSYAFNLGVGFVSDPHNLGKAWFPCIDDFHDRAFYEMFITVEEPKKAVCGGTLLEVINNGNGTKTYHWKMEEDIPTYLASVAVGEYENVPSVFESMSGEDIPIGIYVRPADTSKVEGSFANLIPILDAFENYFGPYPWERVGYVGTAIGAMEHATNIAYPHGSINGNLSNEWLFSHELSHMYFGDLVTCESAEDMWLNEGWAVFCELMYREGIYGVDALREEYRDKHFNVLKSAHVIDNGYRALYGIPTEYTYGETVYQKGGIVTYTLRHYMGDDLFFPAVQAYLDEYQSNFASSWNLRDALSQHSGMDLTDFFDAWVFAPGFPEFSVRWFSIETNGDNFDVTVVANQRLKGASEFANSNRVELTFMDAQWQMETHVMEFSGEEGSQTFSLEIEPVLVMPDYYDKIADATTDQDLVIEGTGSAGFSDVYCEIEVDEIPEGDSAFVRITHRWVGADPMMSPLEGLTLSDYRHWRIDGLFPEGFAATGSFFYNKYGNLDNTLLTDPNDSIIILYRPNAYTEWQSVNFIRTGNSNAGYINVPNLQKGDYTLAVWDDLFVGVSEDNISIEESISVFPNPASANVIIDFGSIPVSEVLVFDSSGKNVYTIRNHNNEIQKNWNASTVPKGTYLLNFVGESGEKLCSKKLLIN
jgi:aminopeptidase N